MKKSFLLCAVIVALAIVPPAMAQEDVTADTQVETQKRAQTGMKFLSTSVDARSTALGGAVTADLRGSSTSLFYNPAAMARMTGTFHVGLAQTQFISDITYNAVSAAFQPQGGNYGVFGVSIMNVDYGDILRTVRDTGESGYVDQGTFSPTAIAVGFGYARSFTDRFSVGAHIKVATQDLGNHPESRNDDGTFNNRDYSVNTFAVDFGILYNTGFRSLVIGMNARNFSQELTYIRESFELPLTFQIGLAMDLIDFTSLDQSMHSFDLKVDAQRPRDFTEHVKVGAEYTFMDLLSLRGGFAQAFVDDEEQGVSLGAGLNLGLSNIQLTADYAYTDFGVFGSVNRFSIGLGL